jgi:hypothetical protein
MITYAECIHARISPFLSRNGDSRRRRFPMNSGILYSTARELRTHVATHVQALALSREHRSLTAGRQLATVPATGTSMHPHTTRRSSTLAALTHSMAANRSSPCRWSLMAAAAQLCMSMGPREHDEPLGLLPNTCRRVTAIRPWPRQRSPGRSNLQAHTQEHRHAIAVPAYTPCTRPRTWPHTAQTHPRQRARHEHHSAHAPA